MSYTIELYQPYEFSPTNWEPVPLEDYVLSADSETYLNIPAHIRALVPADVLSAPAGVKCVRIKSEMTELIPRFQGQRTELLYMYVPLCIIEPYLGEYNWRLKRPVISDAGIAFLGSLFGISNVVNNTSPTAPDEVP